MPLALFCAGSRWFIISYILFYHVVDANVRQVFYMCNTFVLQFLYKLRNYLIISEKNLR